MYNITLYILCQGRFQGIARVARTMGRSPKLKERGCPSVDRLHEVRLCRYSETRAERIYLLQNTVPKSLPKLYSRLRGLSLWITVSLKLIEHGFVQMHGIYQFETLWLYCSLVYSSLIFWIHSSAVPKMSARLTWSVSCWLSFLGEWFH